ncbi:MAG: D-tyrosyl-tRNA(Tyr) deacylase [Thiogranum sp.]|nr:D-tyrosyl-tRNA(Tyr) deacylase [Thiogranum sp.]
MIALLQRVSRASVEVGGEPVAAIDAGLLVLVGVEKDDGAPQVDRLLERILGYRIFDDAQGKMNRSITDLQGGLLLVPQFTLAADTGKGMRPSFTPAADPATGQRWFDYLVSQAKSQHGRVASGVFGASMQVSLVNDGPVTFWLRVGERGERVGTRVNGGL